MEENQSQDLLNVSDDQMNEFLGDVRKSLEEKPTKDFWPLYFLDEYDKCIIISFNANWEPFIGRTRGKNIKPGIKLNKNTFIINQIRKYFMRKRYFGGTKGGRFRIYNNSVITEDDQNNIYHLCQINWPSGRDFFEEMRSIFFEIRRSRQ